MFDIGWPELLVVACVAILVVGPKDLPRMLRTVGKTIGNIKRMAGDFQRQFDDALRDAELDELKKDVTSSKSFAPLDDARKSMEEFQRNVKAEIESKTSIKAETETKPATKAETEPPKSSAKAPAKTQAKASPAKKTAAKPKPAARKKKPTKSSA